MRVGILDDNRAILDYLTTALQLSGHTVCTYTQSSSLLSTLFADTKVPSSPPYDVLVVDLFLPEEISGVDVIDRCRHTFSPEQLPIIILSGANQQFLRQTSEQFPLIPIVQKPCKLKELLRVMNDVTNHRQESA